MTHKSTTGALRFAAMLETDLDAVLALEQSAHAQPWQRQHFVDCLNSAYISQLLWREQNLLAYFIAMIGCEELHLLNLAVAPSHQRQGWARLLLKQLTALARQKNLPAIWLETRCSNQRALQIYTASGFCRVGRRPQYYPVSANQREDAWVMKLDLRT